MRRKRVYFLPALTALILIAGCDPVLETGYKPRPLNASEPVRRSYYAPAFTPEAMPDKKDNSDSGPGFGLGN
jgi:hypothetical protein